MPSHKDYPTVADWDRMGRVVTETCWRAFQKLGRVFDFFSSLQKLGWVFGKLRRVFEILGRVF